MDPKARDKTFDILKGVGITLVVLGHTGSPFTQFIYLFHVPLFFFASGFFFKDRYLADPLSFVLRRLRGLYLPFIAYGLVFLALRPWLLAVHFYDPQANVPVSMYSWHGFLGDALGTLAFRHVELLLAPFWFLTVLFTVNLLFFGIRWVSERTQHPQAATALGVTAVFCLGIELSLRGITLPWDFVVSCLATACYALGYWAGRYREVIVLRWELAAAAFLMLLVALPFSTQLDLHVASIASPGYFLVGAFCGCYLSWWTASRLARSRALSRLFSDIGRASLTILALHVLSFKLLSLLLMWRYVLPAAKLGNFALPGNYPLWWIGFTVLGVAIPLFLHVGYERMTGRTRAWWTSRAARRPSLLSHAN